LYFFCMVPTFTPHTHPKGLGTNHRHNVPDRPDGDPRDWWQQSFLFPLPPAYVLPWSELYPLPTALVREFHASVALWVLTPTFLASIFTQLPALETLALANVAHPTSGIFDSLAGEPSLCPSLETTAFPDWIFTPEAMREFQGAVERRKGSAAAPLYQVVFVSNSGTMYRVWTL